jgi:putative hydrolase of the HAD superfamily
MRDGNPWAGIETVLFDLDHTLVEYRRTSGELLAASFEACDLDHLFPVEAYYERFDEYREEHDSIGALRAACFAELTAEGGYDPALGREVAAAYTEMRDQTNVEFVDGARTVLDRLHGEVPLGVVTNGTGEAQRAKIDAVGLDRWVDAVVYAGEELPAKPDTAPFERALDRLDASRDATLHVGDSLSSDVAGANAAGLHSVWLADTDNPTGADGAAEHTPSRRIGAIDDLLALLDVE